jgi:hypothetical protein
LYNKKDPTEDELLAMATIEADHAMRSLPPHCLPTDGGLPHNEDHANASAHRCWSFLRQIAMHRAANPSENGCIACRDVKMALASRGIPNLNLRHTCHGR